MQQQDGQTGSPSASSTTLSNRGSPSTLATSPTLSPPKSPEVYRQSLSPPSTTGDSPLPPLPAEIYLLILKYLPVDTVPYLMLVSRAWKNSIESEPSLWPNLAAHLDYNQDSKHERLARRANVNASRFGGGIKELSISTNSVAARNLYFGDASFPRDVLSRLEYLYRVIEFACVPTVFLDSNTRKITGPSTLETVKVLLAPNTSTSLFVLESLVSRSRTPGFSAIKNINIQIRVPSLRFTSNFFSIWPELKTMTINSIRASSTVRLVPTNWRFALPPDNQGRLYFIPILPNLQSIFWSGTQISRSLAFPDMPCLTTLVLTSVVWEGKGFFFLLRKIRKTLAHLECVDFNFQEDEGDEGWSDFDNFINILDPKLLDDHHFPEVKSDGSDVDFMTEPAPIILPSLHTLILVNESTPPLFASLEHYDTSGESPPFPTPVFHMPNLQTARFEETNLEEEDYVDDSDTALAVFGRNAPNITVLSISGTGATPKALFHCFAGMSAKIIDLDLNNSLASDALILRLKDLTPRLEVLDVRRCTDITIQGVARLAETMRDDYEGKHRMKEVKVDAPEWGDAELTAYLWLDYVGVLRRPDWDFEGYGPTSKVEQMKFRKLGKRDSEVVERERLAAQEKQERATQQAYLLKLQKDFGFVEPPAPPVIAGGSSSTPYFAVPSTYASSDSTLSTLSSDSSDRVNTTTSSNNNTTIGTTEAQALANLVLQQQLQQFQYQNQQQSHAPPPPPTVDPRIRRASAPSPVESSTVMDIQDVEEGEVELADGELEGDETEEDFCDGEEVDQLDEENDVVENINRV